MPDAAPGSSSAAAPAGDARARATPAPSPSLAHVARRRRGRLAAALLADVWVVDSFDGARRPAFAGVAVTRDGRVWSPATRELRQVPAGGEDHVLAERNRRDALVAEVERAAQAEQAALAKVEEASRAVAGRRRRARRGRPRGRARRPATRDEAAEAERHAGWLIEQRRTAPDEGPAAERRAQLEAALASERRLIERAERERAERERRIAAERERLARDEALRPAAERLAEALAEAGAAVGDRGSRRSRPSCRPTARPASGWPASCARAPPRRARSRRG